MRNLIRKIRQRFHPLFYARKSSIGRLVIKLIDRPTWLSVKDVNFKVRGRLLTHGLAFGVTGSQEVNPEALAMACIRHLGLHSFWDVGANIGHYTWLTKTVNPDIEVVLFEPLPANIALIRDTLSRNMFSSTTLIPAAASDSPGEGVLRANSLAGATSTLENQGRTFEERHWGIASKDIKISLTSIDEVRAKHIPIDFMKIDVEGHEEAVLRGAGKAIASDQPILFIECGHPNHACLKPLELAGYKVLSGDNLSFDYKETSNFFCIPPRFASSIDLLLQTAQKEALPSRA